ncbi:MAG: hypothetical protein H0U49_09915, partial [Parachlamydiaceae bacterium]|nr:hypothetical protein [Parachlamydiaceae bacterium]
RFGPNIIESWKVEEGHTCPTCLHPVEGCIVDNLTRKISTIVFSKPDYPGKSSKFIHVSGNWQIMMNDRCPKMKFVSGTEGGFIQNFEIRGFKNGDVKISIKFDSTNAHAFNKFLKDNGFPKGMTAKELLDCEFQTKNEKELKDLFEIILRNNTFKSTDLKTKLDKIVEVGKIPVLHSPSNLFNDSVESQLLHSIFFDHLVEKLQRERSDSVKPVIPIPYPGEKGKFELIEGNWEPFSPNKDLCRKMVFHCTNSNSLLKEINVLGYIQGEVRITIEFDTKSSLDVKKYFGGKGINLYSIYMSAGMLKTQSKEETQAFFKELIANNEFPEDQLIKMKEIMVTCEIEPTITGQNSNSSKPRVSECAQQ